MFQRLSKVAAHPAKKLPVKKLAAPLAAMVGESINTATSMQLQRVFSRAGIAGETVVQATDAEGIHSYVVPFTASSSQEMLDVASAVCAAVTKATTVSAPEPLFRTTSDASVTAEVLLLQSSSEAMPCNIYVTLAQSSTYHCHLKYRISRAADPEVQEDEVDLCFGQVQFASDAFES